MNECLLLRKKCLFILMVKLEIIYVNNLISCFIIYLFDILLLYKCKVYLLWYYILFFRS